MIMGIEDTQDQNEKEYKTLQWTQQGQARVNSKVG